MLFQRPIFLYFQQKLIGLYIYLGIFPSFYLKRYLLPTARSLSLSMDWTKIESKMRPGSNLGIKNAIRWFGLGWMKQKKGKIDLRLHFHIKQTNTANPASLSFLPSLPRLMSSLHEIIIKLSLLVFGIFFRTSTASLHKTASRRRKISCKYLGPRTFYNGI